MTLDTTDVATAVVADLFGAPDPAPWDPPTLPSSAPLPCVPGLVGDYAHALAAHYQVPDAFTFLLCLPLVAVATTGRYRVRVRPGWHESVTLFTATVLPSGERKSPTLRHVVAPLRDLERDAVRDAVPSRARAEDARQVAQLRLDRAVKDAARTPGVDAQADLDAARSELDDALVPPLPRLFADDATPESLAELLATHPGGIAVAEAEGGLFGTLAGRYSEGRPNLDAVLKAHNGEPIRVDRKGGSTLTVDDPHLVLALAVQPDVVRELRDNRAMTGRGLAARFLYAYPASLLGHRRVRDQVPVPAALDARWTAALSELYAQPRGDERTTLTLTPTALDLFESWQDDVHEPSLLDDAARLDGWTPKLPGQLVRVAALLTLADTPTATVVDTDHLRTALDLAPFLIGHATRVLRGGSGLPHGAARVLRWIAEQSSTPGEAGSIPTEPHDLDSSVVIDPASRGFTFTTRDLFRAVDQQAWATSVDDVRAALHTLAAHGWIRRNTPPKRPGRPSEAWTTHPALLEHYSRTT